MEALHPGRYPRRVRNLHLDRGVLLSRLKHLLADLFRVDILDPDTLADDELLVGDSFCLDSLDVVELALCVEEEFGVAIRSGHEPHIPFTSIVSLADLIHDCTRTDADRRQDPSRAKPSVPAQAFALIASSPSVFSAPA